MSESDDVLGKVDALLARHRAARGGVQPEPPADFPVLTEIVDTPRTPGTILTDAELARLEQELRLQLLELLGGELERMVEARVHARIEGKVREIMSHTGRELEAEVRRAVREALADVINAEIARLRGS
ncbi:MAG: hypothetical protein MUF79_06375 [Burkholderiales bacterium]|nr:hypothetical protein [Burkholderiales bacterium]